jgi:hypothetical protein
MRADWNDVELSATALAHRRVEGGDAAQQEGEDVDVPELYVASDGQDAQHQGEQPLGALRGHQHLAPVEAVGDVSREGQQEQRRPELQRHHDADRGRVAVGEVRQHQPVLRGALHPGADVGDERPRRPAAVIGTGQRSEGDSEHRESAWPGDGPFR